MKLKDAVIELVKFYDYGARDEFFKEKLQIRIRQCGNALVYSNRTKRRTELPDDVAAHQFNQKWQVENTETLMKLKDRPDLAHMLGFIQGAKWAKGNK